MKKHLLLVSTFVTALGASICLTSCQSGSDRLAADLTGAWRSKVLASSGALTAVTDFEFMYAFNAGGTMTESSNYDASPPVPPAYGVWRKTGPGQYEARYAFFMSKAPAAFEEIAKGGGWTPDGHGVLTEKITVAVDSANFTSTIK